MGQSLDFEFIHENKCKRAVLLFHGMTGSPFEMKKMAKPSMMQTLMFIATAFLAMAQAPSI